MSEKEFNEQTLEYYSDITVPTFITAGIKEVLPQEIIQELFVLCFQRAVELKGTDMSTDYLQVFDITSERYQDIGLKYRMKMSQEQPEYVTKHVKGLVGDKVFNGKVYVIESWNGTPSHLANIDDHYITMLLPSEY